MKKSCFILFAAVILGGLFLAGCGRNELPVIDSLETVNTEDTLIVAGDEVTVTCTATDVEEDTLLYQWEVSGGEILLGQETSEITWKSPDSSGAYKIFCNVTDDETWDSLRIVTDSIQIDVQNYFPMAQDNWWFYDGFYYFLENFPNTIKRAVYSKEELGDNEIRWHIETTDSVMGSTIIDSLDYFSVKDGLVFESVWFYHRFFEATRTEGFICNMPLSEGKSWSYDEDRTATVIEIRDRGTEAFSFSDCAHIEILSDTNPSYVRTIWFAPDVGIISDQTEDDGAKRLDYELMDYGLN